jgi:hypothetical protein
MAVSPDLSAPVDLSRPPDFTFPIDIAFPGPVDQASSIFDMASSVFDMAGGALDMPILVDLATSQLSCRGIVDALIDGICLDLTSCLNMATTQARNRFINALSCGQEWCLGSNEMGPGVCVVDPVQSRLVDAMGVPMGSCVACLNNALAMLFLDVCNPVSSPDCNPPQCVPLYDACLMN